MRELKLKNCKQFAATLFIHEPWAMSNERAEQRKNEHTSSENEYGICLSFFVG